MVNFSPVELIKKKRDGIALNFDEISFFVKNYIEGNIPDYQASSLLMAIFHKGMDDNEIYSFTKAFIESGEKVDLAYLHKPVIDKHSTGGVGDKTSIILAPLLACFDIVVPMMSGRGLGHTGGTLDKLESIPGFKIHLTIGEFKKNLELLNVCMIGQTDSLTPADKKFYALRDVTGTVENIGLITSSIVSKKIAEGSSGIVYDVKVGSGSTLPDLSHSRELAKKLISVTKKFGANSLAVLTDMNEPLGYAIGNWLEIEECVSIMNNFPHVSEFSDDLLEITVYLAGCMLNLAGKSNSIDKGIRMAEIKLKSGVVFDKFLAMVKQQNGDIDYLVGIKNYPKANKEKLFCAEQSGFIKEINAYKIGVASILLGCGRSNLHSQINYSAGILMKKKVGDFVESGESICTILGDDVVDIENVCNRISEAILIEQTKVEKKSKILLTID
jgi:pyrimidine-nucleoside phosphorylase